MEYHYISFRIDREQKHEDPRDDDSLIEQINTRGGNGFRLANISLMETSSGEEYYLVIMELGRD